MTYGVLVMFAVAALLIAGGVGMLSRLRSSRITERKTYAYRMTGVMLTAAGVMLVAYALALRSWNMTP